MPFDVTKLSCSQGHRSATSTGSGDWSRQCRGVKHEAVAHIIGRQTAQGGHRVRGRNDLDVRGDLVPAAELEQLGHAIHPAATGRAEPLSIPCRCSWAESGSARPAAAGWIAWTRYPTG